MLSPEEGARQVDAAYGAADAGYDGFEGVPEAVDQFASMGSVTNSLRSGVGGTQDEDGPPLAPSLVDIKRLQKLKADQEQRLKSLCTRVDRLTNQEQKVWKDVAETQQRSLRAQEKQWQRQAQEAERLRMEREMMVHEQALKERARLMRLRTLEMKDVPRLQKFDENKATSRQIREEAERQARGLRNVREQELEKKCMQVDLRRQQRRQQKLQRELELTRNQQAQQDSNLLRFQELQEEIQNAELAISVAEREELSAVHRLQNSQTVRNEVLTQLHDIEKTSAASSPRSANPRIAEADGVGLPVSAPPPQSRSGMSSARGPGTRSSPRLGYTGASRAAPQASVGRLGGQGARSSPGLAVGRTDLSQITEEEAYANDPTKKSASGPRTRALQMQRQRQSNPARSPGANAARPSSGQASPAARAMQEDLLQQQRADMARRLR